jgi:hypothetical protein
LEIKKGDQIKTAPFEGQNNITKDYAAVKKLKDFL